MRRRPVRSDQRGSVTIWILGLMLVLFFFGGMALDLWQVLSRHATVTAIADAAAIAGADAVDRDSLRFGEVALDPDVAAQQAVEFARTQPEWRNSMAASSQATSESVTVDVSDSVEVGLLQVITWGAEIEVMGSATAQPTRTGSND